MSWFGLGKKESVVTNKTAEVKQSWLHKVKSGLSSSSQKLNENLKDIFVRKKIDAESLQELEDTLIMSDLGVFTSSTLTARLRKEKFDRDVELEEVKQHLADYMHDILAPVAQPLIINASHKPEVILMCGVNGTGKTTTIGKLAAAYTMQGKKVMVAACDTFRAAAVEQLQVWAKRAGVPIVMGAADADPASVAFAALEQAKQQQIDILFIDTAGRLHNKKNLMEQLAKIVRVIQKADEHAPHHSLIVLDATTGQNAMSQMKHFKDMINVTGMIVTKLDGTAKGGVVVGLAQEFKLPVHFIGVGESIDDLQPFDARSFADALVGLDLNH